MQGRLRRIYNSFYTGVEEKLIDWIVALEKKMGKRRGESGPEDHDEGGGKR